MKRAVLYVLCSIAIGLALAACGGGGSDPGTTNKLTVVGAGS
jgi:hypothetical protein